MDIGRAKSGITIPENGYFRMNADLYAAEMGEALRAGIGERRHAAKLLAQLAGSTERAARNWLSSVCGPQGWVLILLMARDERVAEAVGRLVERQQRLDAQLDAQRARRRGW